MYGLFCRNSRKIRYEDCYGAYWTEKYKNKSLGIIWLKELDIETIVHECAHVTNWMMREIGFNINSENDEPYTYYMGYLVSEIFKLFELKKILK